MRAVLRNMVMLAALAAAVAPLPAPAQRVPDSAAEVTLSYVPVVRAAAPAVVNIFATRVLAPQASPFMADPFFGQFFREFVDPTPRVQSSLGSGVILSADGLVVSNYHVVGEATEIRVVLNDRREFAASVVLADEGADLAVLRLEGASDLPALELRDSDEAEVGELVLAIGNPFGVGQTVSSGIVSGLARSGLSIGDARGYFIQTDAAVNPGNSGGALVDMAGRLLGINTAILSRSGGSIGIGFAIPANLVRQFVAQARAGNTTFLRPWAGVTGQTVDASLAQGFGLGAPEGVVIAALHPASPFAEAGVQVGDIVTEIGGAPVNTPQEMIFRMTVAGIGTDVPIRYLRGDEERTAEVALIAPPEVPARAPVEIGGNRVLSGLRVETINPAVQAERGLPPTVEGVIVTGVRGFAARIGLRPGDIVLRINGRPIATTADVRAAADDRARDWLIEILRDGQPNALRFRI